MNWHKKQIMNYKLIAASIKKSILSRKKLNLIATLLLAASSAFAQLPSYVPTNGLVGWWPFNGNANDESGNGNNGSFVGLSCYGCSSVSAPPSSSIDRFGNNNSAFEFSANYDFISIPNSQSLQVSSSFTISIWLNPNQGVYGIGPYYLSILQKWGGTGNGASYLVALNLNGQPVLTTNNGITNSAIGGTSPVALNNWSNVIFTFNNGLGKIYLNGIVTDSIANLGTPSIQPSSIEIGRNLNQLYNYNGDAYQGKLDDIGIWNRALTQQEITALYNSQTCNSSSNTITADGPTTFCAGNSVNLKSDVLGGTYQWRRNGVNISTNATSRTFKASLTGSYTCVATCNGTALTSNAIAVTSKTNASATVSASGATSFCAGDSVTLNATNLGSNYSVQWYRTNISMENATNYSQVVKQPGTYKVVTRNLTNGCSRISGSAITTNVNCRIAGDVTSGAVIQENTNVDSRFIDNELSQGVHIFPNPNSGVFSFNYDGEETGDAVLQVINNLGQSIYQSRLTIPEGGFTQDLQLGDNITKGIYIVRLLINDSYHDSKVMVK
jgi:hypothetical protein